MSKFQKQLEKLTDEQVKACAVVLLNRETHELMRIVMTTPWHSRPIQVKALRERIQKIRGLIGDTDEN